MSDASAPQSVPDPQPAPAHHAARIQARATVIAAAIALIGALAGVFFSRQAATHLVETTRTEIVREAQSPDAWKPTVQSMIADELKRQPASADSTQLNNMRQELASLQTTVRALAAQVDKPQTANPASPDPRIAAIQTQLNDLTHRVDQLKPPPPPQGNQIGFAGPVKVELLRCRRQPNGVFCDVRITSPSKEDVHLYGGDSLLRTKNAPERRAPTTRFSTGESGGEHSIRPWIPNTSVDAIFVFEPIDANDTTIDLLSLNVNGIPVEFAQLKIE